MQPASAAEPRHVLHVMNAIPRVNRPMRRPDRTWHGECTTLDEGLIASRQPATPAREVNTATPRTTSWISLAGRRSAPPLFLRAAALCAGALLAVALLLAACGRARQAAAPVRAAPEPPAAKAVEIGAEPLKTGLAPADERLAAQVRARLAADPRLHGMPVEVDAQGGRVTLWGKVERSEDKTAAGQLARGTPGATTVANLIEVQAR
jgi:hyperosmotically inducible periplasmic protein